MAGRAREPGESTEPRGSESRRLAEPPSARYGAAGSAGRPSGSSAVGPLVRAAIGAVAGAAALVVVGAIFASTAGLLFVAGITGAGIGLVLARARVPDDDGKSALSRRAVTWLAIGLAVASVLVAAVGTWLIALDEGGVLGPIDYLLTTFGPFVPGEILLAGLAAAWGAGAGPVER